MKICIKRTKDKENYWTKNVSKFKNKIVISHVNLINTIDLILIKNINKMFMCYGF